MTALTMPPRSDASLRPVPWRRMAWVTWRQHRFALGGVVLVLGGLAVYLWRTGLGIHQAWAADVACRPANSAACGQIGLFLTRYVPTEVTAGILLTLAPALIGAFVGAPVLARELETGTFRYAWTQGFGRWRWTLGKLVPLAVAVTAATGALSVLSWWFFQPFFADNFGTPLAPALFDLRGVAYAAWTLVAFAIGALAGMLIRRVVIAMAATLAAYAGLAFAAGLYLRLHYLPPALARNSFSFFVSDPSRPVVVVSQWWTKGGTTLSPSAMNQVINSTFQRMMPTVHSSQEGAVAALKQPTSLRVLHYLGQHGYTEWTRYQPAGRFWPLQWIEGGWLLALSVLLIGAVVWLVRRRAA